MKADTALSPPADVARRTNKTGTGDDDPTLVDKVAA
jgi:hypothetical protein